MLTEKNRDQDAKNNWQTSTEQL